MKISDGS
ncbi:Protein of unknown function [Bacillus cereus]|nr:Protein of unknown function [Bacillus cereus]